MTVIPPPADFTSHTSGCETTVGVYEKPSLWAIWKRGFYWNRRRVIDPVAEVLVNNHVEMDNDDHIDIEDELDSLPSQVRQVWNNSNQVFRYEVTVGRKVFKKRRKHSYISKLVLELKLKFPFELTPRTAINYASVQRHAISIMEEHNLRKVDQARIIGLVVERYFIPTQIEFDAQEERNTMSAHYARQRGLDTYVDRGVQRFINLGLRAQVGAPQVSN
jgi:hypothetical protein